MSDVDARPSPVLEEKVLRTGQGVRVVWRAEELSRIHGIDLGALVWRRPADEGTRRWLETLDPDALPSLRVITPVEAVPRLLAARRPGNAGYEWDVLTRDIIRLAHAFGDLVGGSHLRLRLDVVTTNACRRYHMDRVPLRLVCTYRGTGTQFGPGRPGRDPDPRFMAPPWSPLLLRGIPGEVGDCPGIVHRSPPIEGMGETRLVLVLDPVSCPDAHAVKGVP
ncbi:MAG: DUF1826 domain-containing protein [Rhodospirillum sp.]|nr:DUF1826 domain-containing protein [Rhodospirillum sp.]MCF8488976.1 DUF1826 domain-containing protein [Rhodospirillum sp.]MCF8500017.1 DUF1826 domain-containing protein [Rhodospirillum sp.]